MLCRVLYNYVRGMRLYTYVYYHGYTVYHMLLWILKIGRFVQIIMMFYISYVVIIEGRSLLPLLALHQPRAFILNVQIN